MAKPSTLREQNLKDLKSEVENRKRELFNLRVRRATGKLEKNHQMREARREIARLLTVIREKEKAGEK